MMNAMALGLVLTSLVTAAFFSPSPDREIPKEAVIVKEGRRVVVVEYEDGDGSTKVSISPKDDKVYANDASVTMEDEIQSKFRPKELVCDAYGKCKHVLASAMGKTRETVAEKARGTADRVYDVKDEAVSKVKDAATDAGNEAYRKAQEVKDSAGQVAGKAKDKATDAAQEAYHKAQEVKDSAGQVAGKAKDKFGAKTVEVAERARRGAEEVKEGVEREGRVNMERSKEKAEEWMESAEKEGKKEVNEMLGMAVSVVKWPVGWLRGVLHLMGFAVAYGMCVWVTFASSTVLGSVLGKQQFSVVQSRIYPVYFKWMGYSVGMALLGHLMSKNRGVVQGLNLAAALGFTIWNMVWVEPRATKVMFERMRKEKEEGGSVKEKEGGGSRGGGSGRNWNGEILDLSGSLQRLNSYSSALNMLTLLSLTWHLLHLAHFLRA